MPQNPRPNLPPGFELDAAPATPPTLPKGFVLDPPREGAMTIGGEPKEEEPSLSGFAYNALASGVNLLKNTAQGAMLLGKVANAGMHGGLEFLTDPQLSGMMQGAQAVKADPMGAAGKVASGAKDYLSKRWGSPEKVGRYLYEDPFGLAADAATALSLGGGAAARLPGAVGRVGSAVAEAGSLIDPMTNVGRAAVAAAPTVARGVERTGEAFNRSALGTSGAMRKLMADNDKINLPRLLGQEGLLISRGSQATNDARIASTESALGNLIAGSTKTTTIAPVTEDLRALSEAKRTKNLPGSELYEQAPVVDAEVRRLFDANSLEPPPVPPKQPPSKIILTDRTPPSAPAIPQVPHGPGSNLMELPAQRIHSGKVELNKYYKAPGAIEPALNLQMRDAMRRGSMKTIETLHPETAGLNAELGGRYALDDAIDTALEQGAHFTPADAMRSTTGGLIGGGIGALLGHGVGGTVAGAAAVQAMKSPLLKSLAGRELFRLGRNAAPKAAALQQAGPWLTRLALLNALSPEPAEEPGEP